MNGAEQLDFLRSEGFARRTDPKTSKEASATVDVARLEAVVLQAIATLGTATIHEAAASTGLPEVSISPRFRPLADKGLIVDTRIRRQNPSGRKAIVWKVVR